MRNFQFNFWDSLETVQSIFLFDSLYRKGSTRITLSFLRFDSRLFCKLRLCGAQWKKDDEGGPAEKVLIDSIPNGLWGKTSTNVWTRGRKVWNKERKNNLYYNIFNRQWVLKRQKGKKINVKYRLRLGSVPAGWEVGPGSRTDPVIDPQVGFGSWDSRMDTGVQLRKGEGTMMMRLKDENSVKRWGEMFVSIFCNV